MEMFYFLHSLPNDLRKDYYSAIITNGEVDDAKWEEIARFLKDSFKKRSNIDEDLKQVFKYVDDFERKEIMNISKENPDIYNKLNSKIFTFEEIINVNKDKLATILNKFSLEEVFKAMLGTSPTVRDYIIEVLDINNIGEQFKGLGSVPITEITKIHSRIINEVNNMK
ncbi:MAG: FliG C-terminal domain-containing protein [Clostridiaceae bacterium]|nr:FliG C-terminal domain-containing protein [Clostridiaceae bacterium]